MRLLRPGTFSFLLMTTSLVVILPYSFALAGFSSGMADTELKDDFEIVVPKSSLEPSLGPSLFSNSTSSSKTMVKEENPPVLLQADGLAQDKETGIIVAQGHVEIVYGLQVLQADEAIYYPQQDKVTATGNVALLDEDGNVYFAEEMQLSDKMRRGFVKEVHAIMADGSRMAARQGHRIADDRTEMDIAVFSPCDVCAEDPDKPPLWQLKAQKVINDEKKQDIIYHNARLEMFGVPVMYTPYLSTPAPGVKRRSGLLMPSFGFSSKHGYVADASYYHTFDASKDGTLRLINTGKSGSVINGEWRERMQDGQYSINASINRGEQYDNEGNLLEEADWRGHLFADGQWDINSKWRAGYNFARATDKQYMEDFGFSNADVLTNSLYLERLSGRNTTDIKSVYFYDLRKDINETQPELLPWVRHSMVGNPESVMGGRWAMDLEALSLSRRQNSEGQSVTRVSAVPSWSRETIFPIGLASRFDINTRVDNYSVEDSVTRSYPADNDYNHSRGFANIHAVNRYPLVNPTSFGYALVEPKLSLTVAPNPKESSIIPNEDSRDVQLDFSNLFDANRYPGSDRMEKGAHTAYGVKVGLYEDSGKNINAGIGQSVRLSGDPAFPDGSGLENKYSDYVGNVEAVFNSNFKLDYRYQLDQETLADRRHELQSTLHSDSGAEISASYLYAEVVEGTGMVDRQQLRLNTTLPMTDYWSFTGATLHDLSGDAGLLKAQMGFIYQDECFTLSTVGYRSLTDSNSASDFTILTTLSFTKLGTFIAPTIDEDLLGSLFGSDNKDNNN